MREYFTYGSVRGAAGDGGPYRDPKRGGREDKKGEDANEQSRLRYSEPARGKKSLTLH
jgi:hypothetical protein